MNRLELVKTSADAASACALSRIHCDASDSPSSPGIGNHLLRHRFGVNYVPSINWYYCYNDWQPSDIARDLDRIVEIGADHLRVMLIWPWFQPNPSSVSSTHLDRLDELMELAAARKLDVLPALFTGWLSGFHFNPVYLQNEPFFTSSKWAEVQDLYLEEVSRRMQKHSNFIGYDIGNEINCNWSCPTEQGDAWMERIFTRMNALCPGRVHVNGVDHQPWFTEHTFSADALATQQSIVALHCWPCFTNAGRFGKHLDTPYTHLGAGMAALARSFAHNAHKPIWMQEFGAGVHEMPETDIPRWLEATFTAAIEQGVSWFTWWSSHDVNKSFEFLPLEYGLGLMTVDNRIKEQGPLFKRFADAYRGKPVKISARPLLSPPAERNADATWRWLLEWMT